jgi:hypothetical protein
MMSEFESIFGNVELPTHESEKKDIIDDNILYYSCSYAVCGVI